MRWIDMHCDTVSEIYKNRKGTLMKNTLCVEMEQVKIRKVKTEHIRRFAG